MINHNRKVVLAIPLAASLYVGATACSSSHEANSNTTANSKNAPLSQLKAIGKLGVIDGKVNLSNDGQPVNVYSPSDYHQTGTLDHNQNFAINCFPNSKHAEFDITTSSGVSGDILIDDQIYGEYTSGEFGSAVGNC